MTHESSQRLIPRPHQRSRIPSLAPVLDRHGLAAALKHWPHTALPMMARTSQRLASVSKTTCQLYMPTSSSLAPTFSAYSLPARESCASFFFTTWLDLAGAFRPGRFRKTTPTSPWTSVFMTLGQRLQALTSAAKMLPSRRRSNSRATTELEQCFHDRTWSLSAPTPSTARRRREPCLSTRQLSSLNPTDHANATKSCVVDQFFNDFILISGERSPGAPHKHWDQGYAP